MANLQSMPLYLFIHFKFTYNIITNKTKWKKSYIWPYFFKKK